MAYLSQSLRELDRSLGGSLHVIAGDPAAVLKELLSRYEATEVHISEEFEPYGLMRDRKVEEAGVKLIRTGGPYAVAPGRVRKPSDGTPYKVYTPFYKAWLAHGWRDPAPRPTEIPTVTPGSADRDFPTWQMPEGSIVMPAGEDADTDATTTNTPDGQATQAPVDTVSNMAKRAAKTRGAAL
jgi:deoxyribodipyrimidine photo-lyase